MSMMTVGTVFRYAAPSANAKSVGTDTLLMETARNMFLSLRITEKEVLAQGFQGLTGEGAVVSELEAGWVISRLDELVDWKYV